MVLLDKELSTPSSRISITVIACPMKSQMAYLQLRGYHALMHLLLAENVLYLV